MRPSLFLLCLDSCNIFKVKYKHMRKISIVFIIILISSFLIADAKENVVQASCSNNSKELELFYSDKNAQINPALKTGIVYSEQMEISELLNLALQNNPKVHKAIFKSNASKTIIDQTKGLYSPELQVGSGFVKDKTNFQNENINLYPRSFLDFMYGRISISQLVYDFGTTSLKIKMAKDIYEASRIEIDTVINNLIYEVRDKYYYLIFVKFQKNATEELYKEFQEHTKLIQTHYKGHSEQVLCKCTGSGNIADQSNLELNISMSEKLLNDAENDLARTQVKLNNLIGLPYATPYNVANELKYEILEITPESLIKIANTSRPELKYAQTQIELAQKKEKSVIKELTPRINIFGSYGAGGASYENDKYNNYNNYQVGTMLSTSWINPAIVHKKILEAKFVKNYEQANALETAYNTYLEIQEASINYNTAIKNVEKTKKTLEKSEKVLDNFRKMYANGEDCYILVGEFAFIFMESKIDYYNSLYKLNSSKAAMDKAVGKIITNEDITDL